MIKVKCSIDRKGGRKTENKMKKWENWIDLRNFDFCIYSQKWEKRGQNHRGAKISSTQAPSQVNSWSHGPLVLEGQGRGSHLANSFEWVLPEWEQEGNLLLLQPGGDLLTSHWWPWASGQRLCVVESASWQGLLHLNQPNSGESAGFKFLSTSYNPRKGFPF